MNRLTRAASSYGWLLALAVAALALAVVYVRPIAAIPTTRTIRALSPAELTTALDVCEDPNTVVVRQIAPSRYQAELQVDQTRYFLTWAEGSPAVNIDDARVGAVPGHRTEPVNTALVSCLAMKGAAAEARP